MNGSAIPGCSEQGYKFVYNVFGHFLFALQRVSAGILAVDDRYFVGITPESCSFVVQGTMKSRFLRASLSWAWATSSLVSSAKPTRRWFSRLDLPSAAAMS